MDTSTEYIKQCEKAAEVQELYPNTEEWDEGDVYSQLNNYHHYKGIYPNGKHIEGWSIYISCFDGEYGLDERIGVSIWLPRQDQLQGILGLGISEMFRRLHNFPMYDSDGTDTIIFKTMEQLWLAFVMKEKFNKTWGGEDWLTL